jgi:predicted dehydrogenase
MSVGKKIGYAVVGLGNIARISILPAFANCNDSRLVAVVSRDKRKAASVARKFRTSFWFSSEQFDECLTTSGVDAIYIATPPGVHEQSTILAAHAGKHVLCEKPMAADSAQSARMVAACRKSRVLLMTAYRKYFEPSTLFLKHLVDNGSLGQLHAMHTSFSELFNPKTTPAWLLDRALAGGGPMMDLGVYCVNTTRWLAGEDPVEAVAHSWTHNAAIFKSVEEGVSFSLKFPSGLRVQGSSTYGAAMSSFLFVQGTRGWLSLSPAYPYEPERRVIGNIAGQSIDRRFKPLDEFALEIDAFSRAIQKSKPVEPDGVQGHRDMLVLKAIYESARTERPVAIHY